MPTSWQPTIVAAKRTFLIIMLSLIGCAAVACVALVAFSSFHGRWIEDLFSAGLNFGFMLALIMGAFHALEKGRWRPLALLGILAAAGTIVLVSAYLFYAASTGYGSTPTLPSRLYELFGRLTGSSVPLSSWLCLVPLVGTPRFRLLGRLVQLGTVAAMTAALACLMLIIWWDPSYNEDVARCLAASLILSAAGLLTVFILAKFFAIKTIEQLTEVAATLWLRCPRCLREQELSTGDSRCPVCRLKFHIEIEEPRCPNCHYLLRGLTRPLCPECGSPLAPTDLSLAPTATDPSVTPANSV